MTLRPIVALAALLATTAATAQTVRVDPDGSIAMPAMTVPSSPLMSNEGNRSRVEHIMTERSLKGRSIADLNAALFGPRLERAKARYKVSVRRDTIGGIPVLVYEPAAGVAKADRGKVLLNVHGGGFVGCFTECGGLESVPVAALTGIRVISIDYRLAPQARYPAASEDVSSVYRAVLKTAPARRIGLFGCSAGGLLTAQSLAWFQTHGLPAPAVAGIFCAGADATMAGDSRTYGAVLGDGEAPPSAAPRPLGYMAGAAATDTAAFPARDASVLAKFPPTLVVVGTRDFALSSAVYLHSRLVAAGVPAQLNVWEGGRHAFFYDADVPEAREAHQVIARFLTSHLR
ncbi:alpha/beta hydrolase [Sphingomonas adhaesiva]|uniref:alpha/beta hydrolase n=1 Tax=Sphingomonas adhaesiva TaxID=28212 RepID=UPI002FF7793F